MSTLRIPTPVVPICHCYCGLEFGTPQGLNAHIIAMRVLPHARPVTGQTSPLIVPGLPTNTKRRRRTLDEVLAPEPYASNLKEGVDY